MSRTPEICSPRTRGWSLLRHYAGGEDPLLPARAGIVPVTRDLSVVSGSAPRARGG